MSEHSTSNGDSYNDGQPRAENLPLYLFAERIKQLAWDADRHSSMWSDKSRKALLEIDKLCDKILTK